jgi:carbonic anhydrase
MKNAFFIFSVIKVQLCKYKFFIKNRMNRDYSNVTPAEALEYLKEGNQRFVNNKLIDYPLKEQVVETASGQKPFAVILSCMDSRASVELIFNKGIGHLFSVRIAGNVVSDYVLASLEYATAVVGARVILVMGHSDCGAIKGACDEVKLGSLTDLLAKIRWAVTNEDTVTEDRTSKNKDFVDKVAMVNVHHSIDEILYRSPIIQDLHKEGKIAVVPAFYDVKTGEVKFFEEPKVA